MLIVALIGITVLSCSKESKIERNLHKKEGVWNIDNYKWYYYSPAGNDGQDLEDRGTFQFEKDGTGKLTFIDTDGLTYTYNFTYDNTAETISIVSDGQTTVYKIDSYSKDVISMSTSTTTTNFDGSITTEGDSYIIRRIK